MSYLKSCNIYLIWILFLILEMDQSLPKIFANLDKIGDNVYVILAINDLIMDSLSFQVNLDKLVNLSLNFYLFSVWQLFLHVLETSCSLLTIISTRKLFIRQSLGDKRYSKHFGEEQVQVESTMIQDIHFQCFIDSVWFNYVKKFSYVMHILLHGLLVDRVIKERKFKNYW